MKMVAALMMLLAAFIANAEGYAAPAHTANEILDAVLKNMKVTPRQIKIIGLSYDYVERIWHVELAPSDHSCIDCFPSFVVMDGEEIVIGTVPHG